MQGKKEEYWEKKREHLDALLIGVHSAQGLQVPLMPFEVLEARIFTHGV